MLQRRSTAPAANSADNGPKNATTNWTKGVWTKLLHALEIHASSCDEARKCRDYIS